MKTAARTLEWFLSQPRVVPFLLALYLVPRVLILLLPVTPTSDAGWYFARAVALADGRGYSEDGVLTAFWPPGWPITLAVIFKLFGVSLFAIQLFNLFCSMVIAWLTWDLGRWLFHSELAGRAALLLLAVYPNSIGYVPLVWTEVYYTLLLLLACWFLIVRQSVWSLLSAGLILGVATLVKAQSMLVIPVIFGISVLRTFHRAQLIKETVRAGVVVLVALAVVLPWSYRNYQVFGEFILVSTNGGLTLLTGNNPSARGDYTQDDPLETSIPRTVATQVAVDKEAHRRAIQWIRENPGRFVALLPLKVFRLWAPDGESEWWFQRGYENYGDYILWFRTIRYLNQAYYLCLLMGFAAAGWLLFSRKVVVSEARIDWWALPYGLALYLTAIALVFSGQSRFHYSIMPLIIMCGGWLLGSVWPQVLLRRSPSLRRPQPGGASITSGSP